MMHALFLLLGLGPATAHAGSPPCVAVEGPPEAAAEVRGALADRGIVQPTGACTPATLSLTPVGEGRLSWSLILPGGRAADRTLPSPEVGAARVDSMVHTGRLAPLLTLRVEPVASARTGARLYASFDA